MQFNSHPDLKDKHAFLSASKYAWLRYSEEKLVETFGKSMDAQRGTELHKYACEAIRLGIKQRETNQTLNMYVNEAIGYRMKPEVVLFYSYNAFGTADAIGFRDRILRIFDLKNGVTPAKMDQLEIYAALFCLEYSIKPQDIEFDLRIFQNDQIVHSETIPDDIVYVMDRIVEADKIIREMQTLFD